MRPFFTLTFFLVGFFVQAQTQFVRKDTIPVSDSMNIPYSFPWTGGMNSCQYSDIDLDLDGTNDLFIFDRVGNKITTFINTGTANTVSYTYAPQYISQFPKLHDWVLLRDYNCDGKMDIFTANSSKIALYKNISTSTAVAFTLIEPGLLSDITPNSTDTIVPIAVSWIDIPAIRDVDNDGDIDVLTYGVGGTQVEFHRNMSMDNYGVCDSMNFVLETLCWGEFTESQLNASISINTPCAAPPIHESPDASFLNLHNGSCLECINVDDDNDQDLLVGDLVNPNITFIRNGGSAGYAVADSIDAAYPSYDSTLWLNVFGCGFHFDADNDGKKDVVFAPNGFVGVENFRSSCFYKNNGSNTDVSLQRIEDNFLQKDMIDVGEGAAPVFFDYDHDGDEDLFVGNKGYYDPSGIFISKLALFKNIGTNLAPSFRLITRDFAGITYQDPSIQGCSPTFGDMDGDGDEDLICGDLNGKLHFFRKDPGNDTNFVYVSNFYQNIDVGSFAAPQLIDVDRDGLIDLLVGEQTGNINYFKNTGTIGVPVFTLITPLFGNVIVTQSGFTTGYSTPYLLDHNGSYILFCGSERGFLFRFDNIDGNLTGNFTLTDSLYVSKYEGGRICPAVADLNNDSMFDVCIGNYAGGVSLFYGDNGVGIPEDQLRSALFSIYPNPSHAMITIETPENLNTARTLELFDVSGKSILRQQLISSRTTLDCTGIASGIYICTVTTVDGTHFNQKLIITH